MAIANGSPYYVAPALLRQFEQDLAPIMALFANEYDWVVCEQKPPPSHVAQLRILGVNRVDFIEIDELKNWQSNHPMNEIELHSWGKSPAEAYRFSFLVEPDLIWQPAYSTLFERKTAAQFLQLFLSQNQHLPIVDKNTTIQVINSIPEVEGLLEEWSPLVLKAPLSSSGRGLLVLRRNRLNEANRQLISAVLKQQGYMTAERWHQKVADLSFQFEVTPSGNINYLGMSRFFTNSNGQYSGHYLGQAPLIPAGFDSGQLSEVAEQLGEALAKSVYSELHSGPLGVDALLFRDNSHQVKLHPCLEINPRYTMGYLALVLQSRIHSEANGEFRVQYFEPGELAGFIDEETKKNPPILVDGLIRKGFLALNPTTPQSRFCTFLRLF